MSFVYKGCRGGFRLNLNPRRFCVHRIRTRFVNMIKLFRRLRSSYVHMLRSLRRHVKNNNNSFKKKKNSYSNVTREMNYALYRNSSRSSCDYSYRLKSFGRSNSFYSEAIADCLDFIKRNSVSIEEEKPVLMMIDGQS